LPLIISVVVPFSREPNSSGAFESKIFVGPVPLVTSGAPS